MECRGVIAIGFLFFVFAGRTQDYSRKPYASIHHYAERLLGSGIVERKEDVNFRKGAIYYYKEKDIEGQYVHISGGYAGDYRLCLWKMKNGNDLVGVTHYNCQASCVYECSFFEFTQDDSTEISLDILPLAKMVKHMKKMKSKVIGAAGDLDDEEALFKFILPHFQGMLRVEISINRNKIEFPILDLEWTGSKFIIHTKFKDIPDL